MAASLVRLPNELLLSIIDYLPYLPRNRRTELLTLSTTCKRLHNLATSLLLTTPYVNLTNTRRLVDSYIARPDLALKVCSLELYARDDVTAPDTNPAQPHAQKNKNPIRKNKQLWKAYTGLVRSTSISTNAQARWKLAIEHEDKKAWIGLLLAVLPNLKTLYLGGVPLRFFEKIDPLCGVGYKIRNCTCEFHQAKPSYLCDLFIATAPRLSTLELPFATYRECWDMEWPLVNYTGLTHLIANIDKLGVYPNDGRPFSERFVVLPPTLQKLSIHCDDELEIVRILECITSRQSTGDSPDFKNLEVYVVSHCPSTKFGEGFSAHPDGWDTQYTAQTNQQLHELIDSLAHIEIKIHYTNDCCYFAHFIDILAEKDVVGYIPTTARGSSVKQHHNSLYDSWRMLELRGAFLGAIEDEAMRREVMSSEEKNEELERENEERRRGRRDRGEGSDTEDSEDEFGGCLVFD